MTTFRAWKVAEIVGALSGEGARKIVIPAFQRNFVWNLEQRAALVESIRRGYPIGTILLYRVGFEGDQERLQLVDGLQRTVTLKKYLDNQFAYVTERMFPVFQLNIINQYYDPTNSEEPSEQIAQNITAILIQWFQSRSSFDAGCGYSNIELWAFLNEHFDIANAVPEPRFMAALQGLLEAVKSSLDILSYEIPVIEFVGPIDDLPEIFDRLNTGGTKLAKYDILAASWNDKFVFITTPTLIEAVKQKYRELLQLGLELEVVDGEHFERYNEASKYLIFEFVFALGRCLKSDFPRLFGRAHEVSTEVDSIGFTLVALASGLRIAQLGEFAGVIARVGDTDLYYRALLSAIEVVRSALDSTLMFPLDRESQRKLVHTEFQIAALVAGVFRLKYDAELNEEDSWQTFTPSIEKHIRQWYVYDIMRRYWRSSGDSKSYDFVRRSQLIEAVPIEAFSAALDVWYQESIHGRSRDVQVVSRVVLKTLGGRLRTMPLDARKRFTSMFIVQPDEMRGSGLTPNNPFNLTFENPDTKRMFDPAALSGSRSGLRHGGRIEEFFQRRYLAIRERLIDALYVAGASAEVSTAVAVD